MGKGATALTVLVEGGSWQAGGEGPGPAIHQGLFLVQAIEIVLAPVGDLGTVKNAFWSQQILYSSYL